MSPSVRGAERVKVVAVLLAAGLVTGATAGFAAGGLWAAAGLPSASAVVAGVMVGAALLLDLIARPLSVRRQVPQAWGRLFAPTTAALLYGARLGVGPLTILSTWTWWAAALVGATFGPWGGAAAGATFHAARTAVMVAAVAGAGRSMPGRMAALRRRERTTSAAMALILVVAGLLVVTACSDDESEPVERARSTTTTTRSRAPDRTTTTVSPAEEGELRALLLEETLPGFAPAPEDRFDTGPLDLDAAARAELDVPAERALLQTRRFRHGHARAWTDPAGDVVLVTLYEFADSAGASAYLRDGADTVIARAAPTFEVPEIPDGFGFTQVDESDRGAFTGHGVAFARGSRYVLVVVGSRGSGRTPDEARQVAVAQLRRLEEGAVP